MASRRTLLSGERKEHRLDGGATERFCGGGGRDAAGLQQAVTSQSGEPMVLLVAAWRNYLESGVGDIESGMTRPAGGNHCVGTARHYSGTLGEWTAAGDSQSVQQRASRIVLRGAAVPSGQNGTLNGMREAGVPGSA